MPDRCECGCEVYKSLRPHVCMKEGGCIAASGEDASILIAVELTATTLSKPVYTLNWPTDSTETAVGNRIKGSNSRLTRLKITAANSRQLPGVVQTNCRCYQAEEQFSSRKLHSVGLKKHREREREAVELGLRIVLGVGVRRSKVGRSRAYPAELVVRDGGRRWHMRKAGRGPFGCD